MSFKVFSFLNPIKRFLHNKIKVIVLDYNYNHKYYLWYINRYLKALENHEKVELNYDDISNYIIKNSKTNKSKVFNFRKQGLFFKSGIFKRGEHLGKDYLLDNITFCNNDVIIDCGANIGDLRIFFENKNIDIKYVAIEPGIEEYKCLKFNTTDDDLLKNICLGEKNDIAEFYYKPEFGDSSFLNMGDYESSYKCEVKTLDSLIEEIDLRDKKIKLFKVEAEGAEPEVLNGAINTLKNIEYISADLGFERGVDQDTTAPQVINYLINNGFELLKVGEKRMCYLFKNKNF